MAAYFEAASNYDEGRDALDELVHSGQGLSQTDPDGMTLLHHACEQGHLEAVVTLVEAGIALEAQTREGRTALHLACIMAADTSTRGESQIECVAYLQSQGAATGTQDHYGCTALSYLPIGYKRMGLNTPSVDGSEAVWAITQVTSASAVRLSSVAQATRVHLREEIWPVG